MPRKPENEESSGPTKLPLKARFVWLWHPHFWLTLMLVVLLLFLLMRFAK